jgi:hypothetical protein
VNPQELTNPSDKFAVINDRVCGINRGTIEHEHPESFLYIQSQSVEREILLKLHKALIQKLHFATDVNLSAKKLHLGR